MSDPAAPFLQRRLPAAQPHARMPPALGAEFPLHTRGAPAVPAEEVTRAGDCTGAASQTAGKLPPPHPASSGKAVGMARSSCWEHCRGTHEGFGRWGKSRGISCSAEVSVGIASIAIQHLEVWGFNAMQLRKTEYETR